MNREESRKRREKVAELRRQNYSMNEISDMLGITPSYVQQISKQCGLDGIRSNKKAQVNKDALAIEAEMLRAAGEKTIKDKIEQYSKYEYIGGYTGSNGSCDVRCRICGTVFKKSCSAIRKWGSRAAQPCKKCMEKRAKMKPFVFKNDEGEQLKLSVCSWCGNGYIKQKKQGKSCFCSSECRKKSMNYKHDHRISKSAILDKDITLVRLYNRDEGMCYLCGGLCNWGDINENVAGDSYPSIDHVVPIAHGGKHAWKNVRLAHRRCNYLKSDKDIRPLSPEKG